MPGTLSIDQQHTFSAPPIVMAVAPRLKFGTEVQEVNTTTGEAKWTVQAAVSYIPQNGMRAVAEVIEVTVTGGDPTSIPPGTPVEFADSGAGSPPLSSVRTAGWSAASSGSRRPLSARSASASPRLTRPDNPKGRARVANPED